MAITFRLLGRGLPALAAKACALFGFRAATEQAAFVPVARLGAVAIRHYPARAAVETVVALTRVGEARRAGFQRLAGYIFGDNHRRMRIAMTAPVAQSLCVASARGAPGAWRIRFFLPAALTLAGAPRPSHPEVVPVAVPAADYAVLRFAGRPRQGTVQAHLAHLQAALADSDWRPAGDPQAWFYDPPWTLPFLRRNEVAIPVVRAVADD